MPSALAEATVSCLLPLLRPLPKRHPTGPRPPAPPPAVQSYHLIPEKVFSSDLENGTVLTTVLGDPLVVRVASRQVTPAARSRVPSVASCACCPGLASLTLCCCQLLPTSRHPVCYIGPLPRPLQVVFKDDKIYIQDDTGAEAEVLEADITAGDAGGSRASWRSMLAQWHDVTKSCRSQRCSPACCPADNCASPLPRLSCVCSGPHH